ncbi:MAG: iron-sulfur cluster assembly accessory protein [Deltaproteobacteria bacterium]|nr:iron-sulfur cluster assembly accessory protein [Deltaproteobacteria bacterium]
MDAQTNTVGSVASEQDQVVALTDKAVAMVKAAMQRESLGPEYGLRVGVVGGGCSGFSYTMSFDNQPKPDDRVAEVDGIRVLVDAASVEYLSGTTLDYVAGLHGAGFKFENPKAERTCGCGSSFSA